MTIQLAYRHLNLRYNPFGELNTTTRAKLAVVEIEYLIPVLQKDKTAIQFVADHGRGKTTHLIALHKYFPEADYTKLQKSLKKQLRAKVENNLNTFQFIDSLEILNKRERRRAFKNCSKIAFTSHNDLSAELKTYGFTVTSVHVSSIDEERLQAIFQTRINAARRSEGKIPQITLATIRSLIKNYHDNIRLMENDLYWRIQEMTGIQDV